MTMKTAALRASVEAQTTENAIGQERGDGRQFPVSVVRGFGNSERDFEPSGPESDIDCQIDGSKSRRHVRQDCDNGKPCIGNKSGHSNAFGIGTFDQGKKGTVNPPQKRIHRNPGGKAAYFADSASEAGAATGAGAVFSAVAATISAEAFSPAVVSGVVVSAAFTAAASSVASV